MQPRLVPSNEPKHHFYPTQSLKPMLENLGRAVALPGVIAGEGHHGRSWRSAARADQEVIEGGHQCDELVGGYAVASLIQTARLTHPLCAD